MTLAGVVVSTVSNPGSGYDSSINYDVLAGQTITVAATPEPHAAILKVAAEILRKKEITLNIVIYDNYDEPNQAVTNGEADANYFQHEPFLDNYNAEHNGNLTAAASIHSEPMGFMLVCNLLWMGFVNYFFRIFPEFFMISQLYN